MSEAAPPSWIARLRVLMAACGWSQSKAGQKLGCCAGALRRVLRGGRPRVAFLVRLQKLEGAHAQQVKDWKGGLVGSYAVPDGCGHPLNRFDFRDKGRGTGRPRPPDLAAVAAVGMAEDRGKSAPRTVYFTPPARPWSKTDKVARARRSEARRDSQRRVDQEGA